MGYLPKVGVEAVVEGIGKFVADMGRVKTAIDSSNKAVADAARRAEAYGNAFQNSLNRVANASNNLKKAESNVASLESKLEQAKKKAAETRIAMEKAMQPQVKQIKPPISKDVFDALIAKADKFESTARMAFLRAQQQLDKFVSKAPVASKRDKATQDWVDALTARVDVLSRAMTAATVKAQQLKLQAAQALSGTFKTTPGISQQQADVKIAAADADVVKIQEQLANSLLNLINAQNALATSQNSSKTAAAAYSGALAALETVMKAVGVSTTVAAVAITGIGVAFVIAGTIVKGFINVLNGVIGAVKNVVSAISGFVSNIWSKLTGALGNIFQYTIGHLLANAIQGMFNEIRDQISGMMEGISKFQELRIQFESLAARDLRRANPAYTVAQSYELAASKAQLLLEEIKQIAVTTPFTAKDIAETIALGNAMGMTTEQSKALMLATGNFAAGMGLTSEHMYRIIYNMGQMISMGKLTGREFRDLAVSFVPVDQILTEMAASSKMTKDQFRDMAMEGGVPVMDFINKFIEIAQRDYPNAMEKMAGTMEGVRNNIKDFFQTVVGVDVFGPIFDKIAARLNTFLKGLMQAPKGMEMSPFRKGMQDTGQAILISAQAIWQAVETKFIPAITAIARVLGMPEMSFRNFQEMILQFGASMSTFISELSKFLVTTGVQMASKLRALAGQAAVWGRNIITSLADGMMSAISAVTGVINQLVMVITNLLQANSPPKALPLLTQWGAAAMQSYLQGWTKADFSVFETVSAEIESYLRSIPEYMLQKQNVIPAIISSQDALMQGINEFKLGGAISPDTMGGILGNEKYLSSNFRTYITSLLQQQTLTEKSAIAEEKLADAQFRVRIAQAEITLINDRYAGQLRELNKLLSANQEVYEEGIRLSEIDAALKTGLLTKQEQQALTVEKTGLTLKKQIRDIENKRDAEAEDAQIRLDAAKIEEDTYSLQVEADKYHLKSLEDQIDLQKSLIEFERQRNELISEQLQILNSMPSGGTGSQPAEKGGGGGGGDIQGEAEARAGTGPMATLGGGVGTVKTGAGGAGGTGLSYVFSNFQKRFAEIIEAVKQKVEELKESLGSLTGKDGTLGQLAQAFSDLGTAMGGLTAIKQDVIDKLGQFVGIASIALNNLKPFAEGIAAVAGGIAALAVAFGMGKDSWSNVDKVLSFILYISIMESAKLRLIGDALAIVGFGIQILAKVIGEIKDLSVPGVITYLGGLATIGGDPGSTLVKFGQGVMMVGLALSVWQNLPYSLFGTVPEILKWLFNAALVGSAFNLTPFINSIAGLALSLGTIALGIQGIKTATVNDIAQPIADVDTNVQNVNSSFGVLVATTTGAEGTMKGSIGKMDTYISDFATKTVNTFTNLKTQLVGASIVPDMMKLMEDSVQSGLATILSAFETAFGASGGGALSGTAGGSEGGKSGGKAAGKASAAVGNGGGGGIIGILNATMTTTTNVFASMTATISTFSEEILNKTLTDAINELIKVLNEAITLMGNLEGAIKKAGEAAASAANKVMQLALKIDMLHDKEITITVRTVYIEGTASAAVGAGRSPSGGLGKGSASVGKGSGATGGSLPRNTPWLVGERGPEIIMANTNSSIVTASTLGNYLRSLREPSRMAHPEKYGASYATNTVYVEVNPTYANYQSPSSIYFDVTAALAAARI